jgi:hypothetical protein
MQMVGHIIRLQLLLLISLIFAIFDGEFSYFRFNSLHIYSHITYNVKRFGLTMLHTKTSEEAIFTVGRIRGSVPEFGSSHYD